MLTRPNLWQGAVTATAKAIAKMDAADWQSDFEGSATEHAASITPVGAYMLSNHVFAKPQTA